MESYGFNDSVGGIITEISEKKIENQQQINIKLNNTITYIFLCLSTCLNGNLAKVF